MSEIKDKCISYYRREAERYDQKRFFCECNRIYDRISKEIVYDYLRNCHHVLDVGTGTGRFAIYLAERGVNVVALDSSKEMLEIAKQKARQEGCKNRIQFVLGDVESLPFKGESFDGVCSIIVLIHFVCRDYAVCELSRVMKSGGIAVLDVPNKPLARLYGLFPRLIGKTTFKDYYYDLREMKRLLLDNSIELVERRAFTKLPRVIVHLFLCILRLRFLIGVIERLEKFNFGGTSIVKGVKAE